MGEPLIRTIESLDSFLEAGLREFDAEKAAQELMARVPAIRVAIEKIRMAQKVSRALLQKEITI